MNIAKLQELIPASFEYKYTDATEIEQTETITLGLRRMKFSSTASNTFRKAIDDQDHTGISVLLAELISEWNMDANGEPFEPTVENIGACPADFVGQLAECAFKRLFPNPPSPAASPNGLEPKASSTAGSMTASESVTNSASLAASGE